MFDQITSQRLQICEILLQIATYYLLLKQVLDGYFAIKPLALEF